MTSCARCQIVLTAAVVSACGRSVVELPVVTIEGPPAPAVICSDGRSTAPELQISQFDARWVTPNTIAWEWQLGADGSGTGFFELVVAETAEDVLSRTGTARVWTRIDNPELGHFVDPYDDVVDAAITDELTPGVRYYAQLHACDSSALGARSQVALAQTQPLPTNELTILADSELPGSSLPVDFALTNSSPYAGTHHYAWTASCPLPETACWEVVRRQSMDLDLSAIDATGFAETAYLEIAISSDTAETPWWAEMRLWFGSGGPPQANLYEIRGWALRADGNYRLYQFPLREFERGAQLPFALLSAGLWEVSVGASWTVDSIVRVDEIRIRW